MQFALIGPRLVLEGQAERASQEARAGQAPRGRARAAPTAVDIGKTPLSINAMQSALNGTSGRWRATGAAAAATSAVAGVAMRCDGHARSKAAPADQQRSPVELGKHHLRFLIVGSERHTASRIDTRGSPGSGRPDHASGISWNGSEASSR